MDRKYVLSFRQSRAASEKKGNWCDAVSAALPGGQMMLVSGLPTAPTEPPASQICRKLSSLLLLDTDSCCFTLSG